MLYLAYNDIVVKGFALSDAFFVILVGVFFYVLIESIVFFRRGFVYKVLFLYAMSVAYVFAIGVIGTHWCTAPNQSILECVVDSISAFAGE